MLNYKILPDFIYNFAIMPQSTYDALSHIKQHSWVILPTADHMTSEGIEFFKSKGIIFSRNVTCWKCNTNTIGLTHIDGIASMGFNFVMKGKGSMEWMHSSVPPIMDDAKLSTGQTIRSPMFPNLDALTVTDTWDSKEGECALVRVHTPHRIVTTTEDRYSLSFRLHLDHCSETFDQLVDRF